MGTISTEEDYWERPNPARTGHFKGGYAYPTFWTVDRHNDLSRNTSGSLSSLDLNSWDGILDDYFDDMKNNNVPVDQRADSGSNHELSFTGDDHTHSTTLNHTHSATRERSEKNPILLESTPEKLSPVRHQSKPSRPRRNVEPPKFFGEQRYLDIVLEKEDPTTEVTTLQDDKPNSPRATFTVTSSSDFLTPLAEGPSKTTPLPSVTRYLQRSILSHRDEPDTPRFRPFCPIHPSDPLLLPIQQTPHLRI